MPAFTATNGSFKDNIPWVLQGWAAVCRRRFPLPIPREIHVTARFNVSWKEFRSLAAMIFGNPIWRHSMRDRSTRFWRKPPSKSLPGDEFALFMRRSSAKSAPLLGWEYCGNYSTSTTRVAFLPQTTPTIQIQQRGNLKTRAKCRIGARNNPSTSFSWLWHPHPNARMLPIMPTKKRHSKSGESQTTGERFSSQN
jgi:hypothetical protein